MTDENKIIRKSLSEFPEIKDLELPTGIDVGILNDINLKLLVEFGKETNRVEYKLSYPVNNEHLYEIVKDVSAFLNIGGGYIVVGVNRELNPIGIKKEDEKYLDPTKLSEIISKYISPSTHLNIYIGNYKLKSENIRVAIIYIPSFQNRPHIINNDYTYKDEKKKKDITALHQGTIYIRRQSSSQPCDPDSWELLVNSIQNQFIKANSKKEYTGLMEIDRESLYQNLFEDI